MYDNESFNPRAPCGARPQRMSEMQIRYLFQSTRPVWGATFPRCKHLPTWQFQSTRPVWGATELEVAAVDGGVVSIHAPRVGRDTSPRMSKTWRPCFNPRAPCGARPQRFWAKLRLSMFQSTRPVWGATEEEKSDLKKGLFQSTRPVWGATLEPMPR